MSELEQEIQRRRTFAIISHPDAGKTTLTEKLLLYSGMLRTAGMVGSRKGHKAAASDWMSMEQERGISITASAMQFDYKGCKINILDTPGHQDFSEDTYRTLTAADSVIMVIDCAKGVEAQTRKLFEACKLRGIPVITLVNKMDSYGKEPIELMEEVENVLGIPAAAMNWPVGAGKEFRGLVDRSTNKINLYKRSDSGGAAKPQVDLIDLENGEACDGLTADEIAELRDEVELQEIAGNEFTLESFLDCKITPVYFGSAIKNYGVEPLFDALVELAPSPSPRPADKPDEEIEIAPEEEFSAYVFKLQANMNPKHRDCIAFMRVNSGVYIKDMSVLHHRTKRKVRLSAPQVLFAAERQTLENAYPGDVIGVVNTAGLAIGDTVSLKGGFEYKKLPYFQPELFARVVPKDLGKRKAIDKGLAQLASEGTIQLMNEFNDTFSYPFLAAVGRLQFEVLQHRLRDEYKVDTRLDMLPYTCSGWIKGDPKTFQVPFNAKLVQDAFERPMVLFSNSWEKEYARKENPDHELLDFA